jgi:hypothetical protein
MKRIPIKAAEFIAKKYGYDQVVIYARKVGEEPEPFGEHMTTFGINKLHCDVAKRIGVTLQNFMGWNLYKAKVGAAADGTSEQAVTPEKEM